MKKVILISGGSDGLGKEIAKRLAKDNEVVIFSNNAEKVKKTAKEIGCDFDIADVSSYEDVAGVVERTIAKFDRIDCVINNAGVWVEGELDANDPKNIERVITINTLGTIYLSKAVIPTMKKQKSGRIINIDSQAGLYAKAERSVYHASKWAITGFTKSLQLELAKYKIGVIGIYPGKMDTKLFEKAGIKKPMKDALDPAEVAKAVEFILNLKYPALFTEVGLKHING